MDISKKAPFPAYKGGKPFIFVSYAHKNADIVFPYLVELNTLGYRVWYDEGIEPGTEWPEAIARAIKRCACMVAFISPQAVGSKNVKNEINFALQNDKPMLCIHIQETVLPEGLALQLGSIQAIMEHKIGSKERFREQMLASLPAETNEPKKEEPPAIETKKPEGLEDPHGKKPKSKILMMGIVAGATAAFVLALALSPLRLFGLIPASGGGSPEPGVSIQPTAENDGGQTGNASQPTVTLRVLYTNAGQTAIQKAQLDKANEDFVKKYPQYKAVLQYIDPSSGNSPKTASDLVSMMGQLQPTVLITNPIYTDILKQNGLIEDLTPLVEKDIDPGLYYCTDKMKSVDGRYWSVVTGFNMNLLIYNKDIFSGISSSSPGIGWNAFDEKNALVGLNRSGHVGFYYADFFHFVMHKLDQFGSYTYDPDHVNSIVYSDKDLKLALENMKETLDTSLSVPRVDGHGRILVWEGPWDDFNAGKLPMLYGQTWDFLQPGRILPEKVNYGIAPVPKRADGGNSYVSAWPIAVFMNGKAGADEKNAAWDYIQYLLSNEGQADLFDGNAIPMNKKVCSDLLLSKQSSPDLQLTLNASIPALRFYVFSGDPTEAFSSLGDYFLGKRPLDEQSAKMKADINPSKSTAPVQTGAAYAAVTIQSFIADKQTVKNGDQLKFTAEIMGDGVEASFDMTQLDTATMENGKVEIKKVNSGLFEADVTISRLNTADNGKKIITLYARSAQGGEDQKTIVIELKNP